MRPLSRKDYAPSRLRYRLGRMWLSRRVRYAVTRVLPLLAVAGLAAHLATRAEVVGWVEGQVDLAVTTVIEHPEFQVRHVEVTGAAAPLAARIEAALEWAMPVSALTLDLTALRAEVEALDPVSSAELSVGHGDTLTVAVTERVPVVVWRGTEGLFLVDESGATVSAASARHRHLDLPYILGAGAPDDIATALDLMAVSEPIAERIRGLVRVGQRRWDVVLDRDQRIKLPEERPVDAFLRVLAQHLGKDELLDRDIAVIDMRLPDRPVLRLTPHAVTEMRRLKLNEAGEDA
ncbi:MAG: cell division protein FtsQ/DivIB [Pseudomonadota bacterium]